MEIKAGVWIDLSTAIIVKLNGDETTKTKLLSEIDTKARQDGEKNDSGRFGKQFINPEKSKEHKLQHQVNDYLKNVVTELSNVSELVIFGPAKMKNELNKKISENPTFKSLTTNVITADSMTDNQTVAWVKNYYDNKG